MGQMPVIFMNKMGFKANKGLTFTSFIVATCAY